jgi:hypothetical protein
MQLLVLVLNKVDCLQAILCGLMKANVTGTTVLDGEGMLQVLGQSSVEPPPIFGSLRQFLNPGREHGKVLFTVLEQSQVAPVKAIIDKAVGGISNPNTGIMFTIDLSSVDGLRA